jgi:hypothetical protein
MRACGLSFDCEQGIVYPSQEIAQSVLVAIVNTRLQVLQFLR